MRKKRMETEKSDTLIDLSGRKDLKIIPAKKKKRHTYENEMEEFERRSNSRYNSFSDFTEFCIQSKTEHNTNVPDALFKRTMLETLEKNELLEYMIVKPFSTDKEQDN